MALAGTVHAGVAGLLRDKTRKPGLPPLPAALVDRVAALTLTEPPGEATHWTGRTMAAAAGISLRSVQRIWVAHRLQPHRVWLQDIKRAGVAAVVVESLANQTPPTIAAF